MAYIFLKDAADEPFRLVLNEPSLPGRIGTTSTSLFDAIAVTVIVVLLLAVAIGVAISRTKARQHRADSWLDEIRQKLRRDYPKYSDPDE